MGQHIKCAAVLLAATATAAISPTVASADSGVAARLTLAHAYVNALVTHDPTGVAFAPDATRVENGVETGSSGPELSNGLATNPVYRLFTGVRNCVATVHGDTVNTDFVLDSVVGGIHVAESITIPQHSIEHLDATITPA